MKGMIGSSGTTNPPGPVVIAVAICQDSLETVRNRRTLANKIRWSPQVGAGKRTGTNRQATSEKSWRKPSAPRGAIG
jgi:hypothetical protein